MGSLLTRNKSEARKKGILALGAWAGSFYLFTLGTVLGGLGLAGAGYLTYKWFNFRAKNGMRF